MEALALKNKLKKSPSVFIVIINWKACDDTIDCLSSLSGLSYANYSVVVVENCSGDNSLSRIKAWSRNNAIPLSEVYYNAAEAKIINTIKHDPSMNGLRQIHLVGASTNTGFCIGNNIGMKIASENGADYILVLNNDTICEKDFLEPLVSYAEENPDIGLMSSLICWERKRDIVWWAGGVFSSWLSPTYVHQGENMKAIHGAEPYDSQWASGCASFFPIRIFEEFGGYDEIFFIWCEEWDLSLKVRNSGYRISVVPKSVIYHKVGKSLGITTPIVFYYSLRNMIMLRKFHLSRSKLLMNLIVYFPSKFMRSVYYSLKFKDVMFFIGFFDAMFDGTRMKGGIWKRQSI